ncbi:MAG: DUF1844 domain-containing protein [candidate division KSB1 bacterium]|nr:DUF1844 domain-containing protein [candidate division KSB1 bacterium]
MAEQLQTEEKNKVLFLYLVTMFQTAAYQQMGKLKNPLTDKIERDLDQARLSIDILDMLLVKTRGNLDDEEQRHLERVIRELKLNYVDEVEKDRKAREASQGQTAAPGDQGSTAAGSEGSSGADGAQPH